jgi:1-acyl-sn-glycerol-3-phosphate acyltransferase
MLILRNILFAMAFYANCVIWFLFACLGYLLPRRLFNWFSRGWAASSMWLFTTIIGAKIEIRGLSNIPTDGAIVAAKHQSSFETIQLLTVLALPTYIYKRELGNIPLFGWHLRRLGQIPVDRDGGAEAMAGWSPAPAPHWPIIARSSSFPRARVGPSAPNPITRSASPSSIALWACPVCRWR